MVMLRTKNSPGRKWEVTRKRNAARFGSFEHVVDDLQFYFEAGDDESSQADHTVDFSCV